MAGRSPVAAALFAAALWTSGCAEVIRAPQAGTSLDHLSSRDSGLCAIEVDRTGLVSLTAGRSADPAGRVLAGFATSFRPGQPPVACDRLPQARAQGVFRFDVTTFSEVSTANFLGAYLDILSFEPLGTISVVDGEPWDLGFGEGWIGGTRPPRSTCLFTVHAAAQAWTPAPAGWGGSRINVENLRRGPIRFRAPRSPLTLDVRHEVEQWLRGEREELGFVIAPADPAVDMKSTSLCVGLFTVQLRIIVRD
jgi:hypothetical protein